jgi:Protein of unknown function (DUF1592)/Protein of unknown function (DUF1588)/Protein of unknown function (DUF1595)/Protein of unknown function (DUF1585)/Protein of unknown function (DUF1587)
MTFGGKKNSPPLWSLLVVALQVAGCSGEIGGTSIGGRVGGGGPTGGPSSMTGNGPAGAACANAGSGPFAVPLQRINDAQYADIIAELFGPTVNVQNSFPASLSGYPYTTYSAANPMGEEQVKAAFDAAESVAMQVADLVPACSSNETSCATDYLQKLAARALRRPPGADETAVLLGAYTSAKKTMSYQESVAVGVETLLQMPQFLYVLENQPVPPSAASPLSGSELAQRMALLYWNGLPDQNLIDAAASGALADPTNRALQAKRMLDDPRAHAVLFDFLRQWMTIRDFRADVHAPDVQDALDEEMRRDIDQAIAAGDGLVDLLTSRETYVNTVLEKFYGLPAASSGPTDWRKVQMDPEQRVGILTHPILLAKFAHGQTASPIFRGKFIRTMVMCDDISPPPPGAQATQLMLAPAGASIRVQSQVRLDNAVCGGCHRLMDPIGFGFSAFDGVGHFVPNAAGMPADVSGHVSSESDLDGDFSGVRALGEKLAKSPKVQACLATQWMRYTFGTTETSAEQCAVATLADRFAKQNNSLLALFAEVSALDAFSQRASLGEPKP